MVDHLLKRQAHHEGIAEADTAVLRLTQLANMMSLQYGNAVFVKAICVTDVNDKGRFDDCILGKVDESIHHSLCEYWAIYLYVDLLTWRVQYNFYGPFKMVQRNLIKHQQTTTGQICNDENYKSK